MIQRLMQWGALCMVVGGVLGIAGALTLPIFPDPLERVLSPLFISANALLALASLFVIVGLPSIYASAAERSGVLGLVGFAGMSVSIVMLGYFGPALALLELPWVAAQLSPSVPPALPRYFFSVAILTAGSAICFGLGTMRSGRFSLWPPAILMLGGVVTLLVYWAPDYVGLGRTAGLTLLYGAFLWYGVDAIWRRPALMEVVDSSHEQSIA